MYESRCPKNAEVIFLFHQLQQGVNPGDESLVGLGIDGVGCKQFDAVAAVRDYVGTGPTSGWKGVPLLGSDPVESVVHAGADFTVIASGLMAPKPRALQMRVTKGLYRVRVWRFPLASPIDSYSGR